MKFRYFTNTSENAVAIAADVGFMMSINMAFLSAGDNIIKR
ncbi:MAG: hypothetical protein WB706_05265 [Nitrososphaeraceae archaeon]